MLEETGITQDTQIVVYCTGGICSGWVVSVLVTPGYDEKNYVGSISVEMLRFLLLPNLRSCSELGLEKLTKP